MRIRRHAAHFLSSTTANPGSPPPQPAAAWLHAAADDFCAFCDLTHSSSQESPDAIKHKGHIAGRVPESEVKSGEHVGLAEGLPAPEAKKCKTDNGPPCSAADAGLGVTNGGSVVNEAAVKLEGARGTNLVTKADVNPVLKAEPFDADDATVEQEVKCGGSLATDEAKPEFTGEISPVIASTTESEDLNGAPLANEIDIDPEDTEKISLESRAATLPGVTGIVLDDTQEAFIMDESGVELGIMRTASLDNEAPTEPELTEGVSLMSTTVTDAGVTVVVPEVTRTSSLSNDGAAEAEATLLQEAAELEATQDPIANQAAWETEDTSCSVDDEPALDEPQPLSCDKIGNLQVGNVGETVAIAMQPSHNVTVDVDGSASSTNNSPVGAKDIAVEGGVAHDRSLTPNVSCILDVVARSIGGSGRTDVICYARRKGKRKQDLLEVKTENIEMDQFEEDETLKSNGPCESVTSRTGSLDVKLADIKRELMDNSAARKVKKGKTSKFECNIDYCRMTFKTTTELSVHKKNMCTVKSCSRQFRSHKYLRRHQSVHNDAMPYGCPWEGCSMAFKWSWDRAEHFQVHAGAKPYKCTTPGCRKIYKFVSDFTRHWRNCKPQRESCTNLAVEHKPY